MLDPIAPHDDRPRAVTLAADEGYDARDFVMELRELNVRPHDAQNSSGRRSAIDRRAHPASRLCHEPAHPQADRGGVRLDQDGGRPEEARFRGLARVDLAVTFAAAAYNLVRIPRLLAGAHREGADGLRLVGRWRIVEADLWDRDALDRVAPATMCELCA